MAMNLAALVKIDVYDPGSSTTKTLRFSSRDDDRATTWNGESWLPLLIESPSVGMSVFDGAFTSRGTQELGSLAISLVNGEMDALPAYNWHGALVTIYAGDLEVGTFTQLFQAVSNGATRVGRQALKVDLTTKDSILDNANVLTSSYTGAGDIEGTVDIKGQLKPFVYGYAKFCEPVLIDPVRQIYQVHGYGPVEAITDVFEGGSPIGTGGTPADTMTLAGGDTYASFRDEVVALGEWIRFNDLGLFKLGSQPVFPISCHVKGDSNSINGGTALTKAADVIKRLANTVTGVTVKATSVTAFNAAMAYPIDGQIRDQVSVGETLDTILLGLGGYWTWNSSGELILGLVRLNAATITLSANNDQLPDVVNVNQLPTSSPVWQLRYGAEQTHFVHDPSNLTQAIIEQVGAVSYTFPPSATAPTDPVPRDGDVWPDTSTTPTTLKRYDATIPGWVIIANRVTQGSDIGVANGATRNNWRGTWTIGMVLALGDLVLSDGTVYEVTTAHTASAPLKPPHANFKTWFEQASLSATISAPAITLPSTSAGLITDYSTANGFWEILYGRSNVTSLFTLATKAGGNPESLTVGYTNPNYAISNGFDPGEESATLTMTATGTAQFTGVTFDRVVKLSKNKAAVTFDTTAPGVPTGLAMTSVVQTNADGTMYNILRATWNAVGDGDLAGYVLAIKEATGAFIEYTLGSTGLQLDLKVLANTNYTAKIRSFDRSGNFSAFSATVSYTTVGDTMPPAAPSGFSGSAGFKTGYLTWTSPSTNQDGSALLDLRGIEIYERTTNTGVSLSDRIAVAGAAAGSPGFFAREGIVATRYYWIAAIDNSGNRSGYAGPVTITPASQIIQAEVANLAIDVNKLADNAVNRNKIQAGEVITSHLAAYSITASKLVLTDLSNMVLDGQMADDSYWTGSAFTRITVSLDGLGSRYMMRLASGAITRSQPIPVEGGQPYFFSAALNANAGGVVSAIARFYSDLDGTVQAGAFTFGSKTGAWVSIEANRVYATLTAPANARSVRYELSSGAANGDFGEPIVRRANNARLIVDGSILTNHITVNTLNGDRLLAGSITANKLFVAGNSNDRLPTGLLVGTSGTTIGTLETRAFDPLAQANTRTTILAPGLVQVSGSTTLANWRFGGDATKIEGGVIGTNSIKANSLIVGLRGLDIAGLEFSHNTPGFNQISWSTGTVTWRNDSGSTTVSSVTASSTTWSSGTMYIYWDKTNPSFLGTTTNAATAYTDNTVVLALYRGGTDLVATYGRTTIEGGRIVTGSVNANKITANSITSAQLSTGLLITNTAQIGTAVIQSAHIQDLTVGTIKIAGGAITAPSVTTGSDSYCAVGTATEIMTTGVVTIGDVTDGQALVVVYATMDSGTQKDAGIRLELQASVDGGGYSTYSYQEAGVRTSDGNSFSKIPIATAFMITSGQTVQIKILATPIIMPGASQAFASTLRTPLVVIQGAKR